MENGYNLNNELIGTIWTIDGNVKLCLCVSVIRLSKIDNGNQRVVIGKNLNSSLKLTTKKVSLFHDGFRTN